MDFKNFYTKLLYIAYFFFTWGIGFTVYSNSKVIEIVSGRESIGFIYGFSALLSLVLSTWVTPHLIKTIGNRRTTWLAINLALVSIIGISFSNNNNDFLFGLSFILFFASQVLISFSFDIFFEHNTLRESSARVRGVTVTLQHVGRILGPMLAAIITYEAGLRAPYQISFFLILVTGIFLYFSTKNFKDKKYVPTSFFVSLKTAIKRKEILKPLTSVLLLQIFYALMVAYVPIYLSDTIGLTNEKLGLIFTIMLLPFILFGYPIGKNLDTGSSGRKAAQYGLLIMGLSTIIIAFIKTDSVWIWILILFISRIGAVILETAGEGNFFRGIKEEETELLGIMRDMQPLGYFIASFIGIIVLYFGEIVNIFYAIGIILFIGIIINYKKKDYIKNENK